MVAQVRGTTRKIGLLLLSVRRLSTSHQGRIRKSLRTKNGRAYTMAIFFAVLCVPCREIPNNPCSSHALRISTATYIATNSMST
jgi:hypothetical protein